MLCPTPIFSVMKYILGLGSKHPRGQFQCSLSDLGIVINNRGHELACNANPSFAIAAGR